MACLHEAQPSPKGRGWLRSSRVRGYAADQYEAHPLISHALRDSFSPWEKQNRNVIASEAKQSRARGREEEDATRSPSPLRGGVRGGGRAIYIVASSSIRRLALTRMPIQCGTPFQLAQPLPRHCERSEAIQSNTCGSGLLRRFAPRNDGAWLHNPQPARLRRVALPSRGREEEDATRSPPLKGS
jgi:hypothetical protein